MSHLDKRVRLSLSMSEIPELGIMVNYETSLLTALKGFQENYRDLADFTIIARNHEEYKSHKLFHLHYL